MRWSPIPPQVSYTRVLVPLIPTLPASWYSDPEIWQAERREVWAKEWIHVGYRYQVDRVGGYVTDDIAGYRIFVHRGTDGELRAFHNVCPHRAGPIVLDGEGCQANLTCRYHGWAFHPDGRLRSARDFGADVPDDIALSSIRVHDWRSMIFVCMSPSTPAFDVWFGAFAAECAEYPIETYQFHSRSVRPMRVNWKTYGDNYLENYHVPVVHLAMAHRDVHALLSRNEGSGLDRRWNVQRAPTKDGYLASGIYTWFWPNFAFDVFPGGLAIERYVPRTIDRTDLIFDYFFEEGATDIDSVVQASEEVVDEDLVIVEAAHANLIGGVYTQGLLSPRHENGLVDFQALLREAVADGGPVRPLSP